MKRLPLKMSSKLSLLKRFSKMFLQKSWSVIYSLKIVPEMSLAKMASKVMILPRMYLMMNLPKRVS